MIQDVLDRLKGIKVLDDSENPVFISTGCLAMDRCISGKYGEGIAVGHLYEISGESSTGKTLFVTTFIKSAQKNGWYTVLLDSENTFSKMFSEKLGIEPKKLIYSNPTVIEDAFNEIEELIKKIREQDKDTPILFCLDSLAVMPARVEVEGRDSIGDTENTDGARRALAVGSILKKITPMLKQNRATLVIVNQLRSKINVGPYQDNSTKASGGRSLPYYLSVAIHLISNKTSDIVRDEKTKEPLGIQGDIKITKNKLGIPFKTCEFLVKFDSGLDPHFGLLDLLVTDGYVTKSDSGRLSIGETKFARDDFLTVIHTGNNPDTAIIRQLLNIKD